MIYLLTAIGLTPGGSSTVHIYTTTIHRTQLITITQQQNNTINNKNNTNNNLIGTMKTEYTEQSIHNEKNTKIIIIKMVRKVTVSL